MFLRCWIDNIFMSGIQTFSLFVPFPHSVLEPKGVQVNPPSGAHDDYFVKYRFEFCTELQFKFLHL